MGDSLAWACIAENPGSDTSARIDEPVSRYVFAF